MWHYAIVALIVLLLDVGAVFFCMMCAGADGPPDWVAETLPVTFIVALFCVLVLAYIFIHWVWFTFWP